MTILPKSYKALKNSIGKGIDKPMGLRESITFRLFNNAFGFLNSHLLVLFPVYCESNQRYIGMKQLFAFIGIGLLLSACGGLTGEELARLPITELSNEELKFKEASLDLVKGDEIGCWTDMDIEFEGELELSYGIEVYRDGEMLNVYQMDAFSPNITLMESKVQVGNSVDWSYLGKIGSIAIEEDGNYTFKAVLQSSYYPTLKIERADLVLKK